MALNSCKENVHPKWRLSRPEGKERHLKEGDFKQWDVKCHKVSLNKSYHFSYPFFWNCPWVNDLLNRNSILQRRSQAPFKTNPKLQSSIAAFCCQPGMEKTTSRAWREPQQPSGLYMQWKYQKCQCWTGNRMHLQVWFFQHNFSARHSFPFCISTTRIQKQTIISMLSIRAHWK